MAYFGPTFVNGSRVKLVTHLLTTVSCGAVGRVIGFRMESGVGFFHVDFPQGTYWVASHFVERV